MSHRYFDKNLFCNLIFKSSPSKDLKIIVVIPSFKEESLNSAIDSLLNQSELRYSEFEIIVILNHCDNANVDIQKFTFDQCNAIQEIFKDTPVHLFYISLPEKNAGVGLARKIGMDAAASRFNQINNAQGIITTFDGDCSCSENHMSNVLSFFEANGNIRAASIHFEHPLQNLNEKQKHAIIEYELHLRTYVGLKKKIGLPYAFQTVGSAMAVRSTEYLRKGGMNKRKAGEDFYFLHKFTHKNFDQIKSTSVYPAARISDRVPFGTGRAMGEIINEARVFTTYNPKSYEALLPFLKEMKKMYQKKTYTIFDLENLINPALIKWLNTHNFESELLRIKNNTSNFQNFETQFYNWFNAFKMMKYLHYMRDEVFENVSPLFAAYCLAEKKFENAESALLYLRKFY